MPTVQQLIDCEASQLGYVEGHNNDNRFGAWFGANYVPWCAEFQSWALYTLFAAEGKVSPLVGVQPPYDKGAAYCPYIVNWSRANSTWRPDPQPGRLALFDWDKDGVADHIGLCVSAEGSDGAYDTIEGNVSPFDNSNGGQVMRRRRSNHLGYSMGFVDLSQWLTAPPTPTPPPAPQYPPWPGRVLTLASPLMLGVDVHTWQQRMRDRGWTISVDGIYGPESAKVCRGFQTDKRLVVDGQVGPVTWSLAWSSPVTP